MHERVLPHATLRVFEQEASLDERPKAEKKQRTDGCNRCPCFFHLSCFFLSFFFHRARTTKEGKEKKDPRTTYPSMYERVARCESSALRPSAEVRAGNETMLRTVFFQLFCSRGDRRLFSSRALFGAKKK